MSGALGPTVQVSGIIGNTTGLMNVGVTATYGSAAGALEVPQGLLASGLGPAGFLQRGAELQGSAGGQLAELATAWLNQTSSGSNSLEMAARALVAAQLEMGNPIPAAADSAAGAWNTTYNVYELPGTGASYFLMNATAAEPIDGPEVAPLALQHVNMGQEHHMPMFESTAALMETYAGTFAIDGDKLVIQDQTMFRAAMDQLVPNAIYNEDKGVSDLAWWLIWQGGQQLDAKPQSVNDAYVAQGAGKWDGSVMPAINLRTLTYDMARTTFEELKRRDGTAIFEIARSEMGYTGQRARAYAAAVIGAAIRQGYTGPIFLQGDHFQVKRDLWEKDPQKAIGDVKDLIAESVAAGFYNIDVDTSVLEDHSAGKFETDDDYRAKQRPNAEVAAELTAFARGIEPEGVTISIGAEVGHIGGVNSTVEDLHAFMAIYNGALPDGMIGISKMSIQSGTSHGGIVLPDGSRAQVKIDFDLLENMGRVARDRYGLILVQHGASTLPLDAYGEFLKRKVGEIHLATEYQNIAVFNPAFPAELRDRMIAYISARHQDERKADWTDAQFEQKVIKKATGPFMREIWSLPVEVRQALMMAYQQRIAATFDLLGVQGTRPVVRSFIPEVAIDLPLSGLGVSAPQAELGPSDDPNAD